MKERKKENAASGFRISQERITHNQTFWSAKRRRTILKSTCVCIHVVMRNVTSEKRKDLFAVSGKYTTSIDTQEQISGNGEERDVEYPSSSLLVTEGWR